MTTSQSEPYDVAVVGGGPAGLAAAGEAAAAGAQVALLDAGTTLGGQYWRHPADPTLAVARHHHGLSTYRALVQGMQGVDVHVRHPVWTVEKAHTGFEVRAFDEQAHRERVLTARSVVLAPGAYDRQVPFPGWDLPGVMAAGGVQALLKGSDATVGGRVLVSGTGPFLLSVAAGLAKAGATVVGVHEAASPKRWLPHLNTLARNSARIREGAGFLATLAKHRIPYITGSAVVAAHGEDQLECATVARMDGTGRVRPGSERDIPVDSLAVGWGFTPQVELPLGLGCTARIDIDGSVVIVVDDEQRSSVPGVFVAGEACGVGGAELAVLEGRVAGAAAAGARPRPEWLARRRKVHAFAAAMHNAYPITNGWLDRVTPGTIVCRCEDVDHAQLREVASDDATADPRSAKLLARVGMGWCQGRTCGYATARLVAHHGGTNAPEQLAHRPVAVPIPLGVLADEPITRRAD